MLKHIRLSWLEFLMGVPPTLFAEVLRWLLTPLMHSARYASSTGLYVSGTNTAMTTASAPASIEVSQLVQCQSSRGLVAMKSALVGAMNGPMKTKIEKMGKM